MSTGPHVVTAHLASPLAGDPPQLDALLEWVLSPFQEDFRHRQDAGLPHSRIDRQFPAPPQGKIPLPLGRVWLGKWLVAQASDPILPKAVETVDHVCKRISVENAVLLREDERKIVSTTNSWTKSYRLPLRVRTVPCVKWFVMANRRNLLKGLKHIGSIGKKVADGYGRVREWTAEAVGEDWSWFAPHVDGVVLMRVLPIGDWLPSDLLGFRRHYGACSPPYWHSERFTEVVIPC